jgi:hypothetical protein
MGRQRKIPPPRGFRSVADTEEAADALYQRLEQMRQETADALGRKRQIERYALAVTIAKALPLGPKDGRRERRTRTRLPEGCLGRTPVKTTDGVELAGFNPESIDPKDANRDMPAAMELQHQLALRGDRMSLTAAAKTMQRVRAWLAETKVP